jgi:hypothetical protein
VRTIDLNLNDERRSRKVQLCSAACGLSSSAFIRAAVDAAMATMAEFDATLALMLRYADEDAPPPQARADAHSHL